MRLDPKTIGFGLLAFALMGGRGKGASGQTPVLRVPKDGARFTLEELRVFAQQIGFPDPALAAAVAMAESGGFAAAVGDNGKSLGLWQINTPSHPTYNAQSLLEPTYNGNAALAISKNGADWSPWTTFRSGAYQRYMPPAIAGKAPPAAQLEAPEVEAFTPTPASQPAAVPIDDEPEPESEPEPGIDDDAPLPLEVEVLDQVEGVDEVESNGVDARVRVSDAPRTGRGRRARRG
jgi:hypothetical protein